MGTDNAKDDGIEFFIGAYPRNPWLKILIGSARIVRAA
jgi:hypothetical protein